MDQNRVKQSVSPSLDGTLAGSKRETATRTVRSGGAEVTSWKAATPNATHVRVIRVVPDSREAVAALAAALGGAGRPAGIIEVREEPGAVVASFDSARSPLALMLAIVAAETAPRPAVELPLDDARLTALGSTLLCEPDLDTYRLIETYIEPMLFESP